MIPQNQALFALYMSAPLQVMLHSAPFVVPFSPYWCLLVGVHVEHCLFVPRNPLKILILLMFQLKKASFTNPSEPSSALVHLLQLAGCRVPSAEFVRQQTLRRASAESGRQGLQFSRIGSVWSNSGIIWYGCPTLDILLFSNPELACVVYRAASSTFVGSGSLCSLPGGPAMPPCRYDYCKPLLDPFLNR